jgi:hypothetical protein
MSTFVIVSVVPNGNTFVATFWHGVVRNLLKKMLPLKHYTELSEKPYEESRSQYEALQQTKRRQANKPVASAFHKRPIIHMTTKRPRFS